METHKNSINIITFMINILLKVLYLWSSCSPAAAWLLPPPAAGVFCPLVLDGAKRLPSVDHYGTDILQSNADLVHEITSEGSSWVPDAIKFKLLKHSAHVMESGDNVGHTIMRLYRISIDYCVDEHLLRHHW